MGENRFATMANSAQIVLTGQQEAWSQGGGPGKYWEDKPNAGYSGTPLWKLHAERAALAQADAMSDTVKIPEGFAKHDNEWYWSDKRKVFWNSKDRRFYVWDEVTQSRKALYEAKTYEVGVSVGGHCHERAGQVKHVLVRDLAKAAQALRMSIEHLDRPCAMYALYEGHRGGPSGNACADFCAKHLHGKLLPRLSAYRGYWEDSRLEAAMRDSFAELDSSFAEKHPGIADGCSAAVALVVGCRLVVASVGDIACQLCHRSGETSKLAQAHAVPDPDADDEEEEDDEEGADADKAVKSSASSPSIRWTRAFGNSDLKADAAHASLSAVPDVRVLTLQHAHHGFAFICRALYQSIGGATAVSTVFRRSAGRPRMASGALVDAAVQWLGNVGSDCNLASVVAFFDKVESLDAPRAKRQKTDLTQVRVRHILVKHRECKSIVDKVRNKQVKRTRWEAERILRGILEEFEGDREQKMFTQRCRDLSECQTCLKAGDLAGDIGWVKRGVVKLGGTPLGDAFEATVFALQVNQLSDLIDSDLGIHVVLRSA